MGPSWLAIIDHKYMYRYVDVVKEFYSRRYRYVDIIIDF